MKRRVLLLGGLGLPACTTIDEPGSNGTRGSTGTTTVRSPATDGGMALAAALAARRSVREFTNAPVTSAEVAQLLWAAQGVSSSQGLRTAPSAGARYPLTVYAAQAAGLYRYAPQGGRVVRLLALDVRTQLARAALEQSWLATAPVVFAITGQLARTAERYGVRAERYVHLEGGHAAQNLLLQATALGLGATPVGAFEDAEVARVLDLGDDEQPLYLLPVGRPR